MRGAAKAGGNWDASFRCETSRGYADQAAARASRAADPIDRALLAAVAEGASAAAAARALGIPERTGRKIVQRLMAC